MKAIPFTKYHALENDFLVIEAVGRRLSQESLGELAQTICHRSRGIGADGIVYLSNSPKADRRIDIYNADGGWAEKSGNGLRIAALHLARSEPHQRTFTFETATSVDKVTLAGRKGKSRMATAELGEPEFRTDRIPVKVSARYVINNPLDFDHGKLPVTCLSVGNPHAVILVDNFDFDWKTIGSDIEHARWFPNGTNVEFVRLISRSRIQVAEWERGAGATGSSGTGAAASVVTMVTLGLVDRKCEVVFVPGSLFVHWRTTDNQVELTGPVTYVGEGMFARP
jgi:diaminopimelate epimerase